MHTQYIAIFRQSSFSFVETSRAFTTFTESEWTFYKLTETIFSFPAVYALLVGNKIIVILKLKIFLLGTGAGCNHVIMRKNQLVMEYTLWLLWSRLCALHRRHSNSEISTLCKSERISAGFFCLSLEWQSQRQTCKSWIQVYFWSYSCFKNGQWTQMTLVLNILIPVKFGF